PSIMFRNNGKLSFDKKYAGATDYDFYFNLIKQGKKITNLPNFLVKYRVHPNNMTIYDSKKQEFFSNLVRKKLDTLPDSFSLSMKISFYIRILIHYFKTVREKKIFL